MTLLRRDMARAGIAGLVTALMFAAAVVALSVLAARATVPAQPPAPAGPAAFTVNGHVYDCATVISQTEAGQDYMPDGSYIYSVLLADCDY